MNSLRNKVESPGRRYMVQLHALFGTSTDLIALHPRVCVRSVLLELGTPTQRAPSERLEIVGIAHQEIPPSHTKRDSSKVPERVRIDSSQDGREIEEFETHGRGREKRQDRGGERPLGSLALMRVPVGTIRPRPPHRSTRNSESGELEHEGETPQDPQHIPDRSQDHGDSDVVPVWEAGEGGDIDEVRQDESANEQGEEETQDGPRGGT